MRRSWEAGSPIQQYALITRLDANASRSPISEFPPRRLPGRFCLRYSPLISLHPNKLAILCCLVGTICLGVDHSSLAQTASFHIGNSLSQDSQFSAIPAFAEIRGHDHAVGFHTRGGSSLTSILEDPNGQIVQVNEDYGNFAAALPEFQWNAITLQPYSGNSLNEEIDSALEFIELTRSNPANADTVFYVYESWPDRLNGTYQEKWLDPLPGQVNPSTVRSRDFFDLFYDRLTDETDAIVKTIPVGEVLYQFDLAAQLGSVPGFDSVVDLYRDHVHMSLDVGRYVASATTFATILNESPIGLSKPEGFFQESSPPLSSEFFTVVNRIIRDVLNSDPDTGVYFPLSDFDDDGVVDSYDLSLWVDSYPGPSYDIDQDGLVNASDFLRWQRTYDTQPLLFDSSFANLDGEGLVDSADLALLQSSYGIDDGGDIDDDGDTDAKDFLALQREFTQFARTDANRDGAVDATDLQFWIDSYGYGGLVDFNEDGTATGRDFLLWQREASFVPANTIIESVTSVPEPNSELSCILLLLTVFWILRFRRGTGTFAKLSVSLRM